MPDFNTDTDTETDHDGDDEQDLKQRAKAYLLAAYAYVASAVAQSVEEIAPQLRSVSVPGISSRAAKSILLAGVLITAAVAMPADPFGGGEASVETQDPVEGTTFEPEPDAPSLNGASLNSLPDSFTGGAPEAPDPPDQVRASAGSQTMNVETAVVDGEPAIVLEDDRTHDGRWVAIETAWFQQHLGEVPNAAFIRHEDGSEYAASITVRGDSAAFYVREFSTNTVTFDGEVRLTGSQAGDGTQYEYELANVSGVDDPSINLTGVNNTAPGSASAVRGNGESLTASVGGTASPRDESVTLTGVETTRSGSVSPGLVSGGYSTTVDVTGNQPTRDGSVTFTGDSSTATDSASGSLTGSGSDTSSVSIGGTVEPTGTSGETEPQISITGSYVEKTIDDGTKVGYGDGELPKEIVISGIPETLDSLSWRYDDGSGSGNEDVTWYINSGDTKDGSIGGNQIGTCQGNYDGTTTCSTDQNVDSTNGKVTLEIADGYGDAYIDDGGVTARSETPTGATIETNGGKTVSLGSFANSETKTTGIDLSRSTDSITVTGTKGQLTYDVSWKEKSITKDPSLTIGGTTVSHSGTLSDGATVTKSFSLSPGSGKSVGVSTGYQVGIDASWTEVTATEDPSVTVDGETVSHSGVLNAGETVTETVSLSTGSNTLDVSTGGEVAVGASWNEVTTTRDPVVELNGQTASYNGTLAEGETVSLSQNSSALVEGTNTVNISTNSPSSGPASLVGFEFVHSAETTVDATVSETTWSQETNVSKTWTGDRANATAEIPMNDRVVDVRNVELRVNGTTWEPVAESNYQLNGTDLTVELGDVAAGSTTEVRATGSKVRVSDGAITVLDPTTGSDALNTRIQVDSAGPDFALAVDETAFANRVHYADNATWGTTAGETTITADGGQTLTLPNATAGAEATVRTWPLEVAPTTGQVTVPELAGDREEPGIAVRGDGNSEVDYTFPNAVDATPYVLYSQTNEIVRDEGLASSPITLTDDNSDETLVFLVDDGSASGSGSGSTSSVGGGGPGPMVDAGAGVLAQLQGIVPSGQTLLIGVGLIGGLFVIGRRSGVITDDRQEAATSAATSAAGTAGSLVERALDNEIVVGALILGAGAFALGTGVLPTEARLIVGLGTAPIAVYLALQQFGEWDFRVWLGSTIVIALLGMNVLAPTFFETIAQEAGILLAVGGVYLGYRLIGAFRAEAETPDEQTNVTFEVDDDDGGN